MSLREKLAQNLETQILEAYKAVGSTLEEIAARLPEDQEYTGEFRPRRHNEAYQRRGDGTVGVTADPSYVMPVLIVRPKPEPTFPVMICVPVIKNGKHITPQDREMREGEFADYPDGKPAFYRVLPDRRMTIAQIAELEQAQ